MADLRDKYGNVVYRIERDRINDIYGNWKYEIRGEYIFDTSGNREYEIRGDSIFDTNGNRLGEMKNLADILPSPNNSGSRSSSSGGTSRHFPKRDENSGCLSWIFSIIVYLIIVNWGGRIGIIIGVGCLILAIVYSTNLGNAVLIGILAIFIFGIVGAIIGGIVNFVKKQVNKGKDLPDLSNGNPTALSMDYGSSAENQNVNSAERKRHGFTSFWLISSLIGYVISGISSFLLPSLPSGMIEVSKDLTIMSGIVSLAGIGPIILLLKWKKRGFWVYCGFSLVSFALGIVTNGFKPLSLIGLISIPIMWGVLHIRKNGKSAWQQLE